MNIVIEKINEKTLSEAVSIWNEVIRDGRAFPQIDELSVDSAKEFFESQTYVGVARGEDSGEVFGMYILHPNNIGRCGHICNASYAVKSNKRGLHIGEYLVRDCIKKAEEHGFKILQFNAVVKSNLQALKLYKKLGFVQLGTIPHGFVNINGEYEDIIPHYIEL